MTPLLAALGAGEIGRLLSADSRPRQVLSGLCVAVILTFLIRSEMPTFGQFSAALREAEPDGEKLALFSRLYAGFQHDDPTAVADWIKKNLPVDAIIAEDHRVNLSATKAEGVSHDARIPQKVYDASFAPDLGTIDQLQAEGVGYVAVCRQNYGRYFNDDMKPQPGVKTGYDKHRDFYARLFQEGKLLKTWPKGPITYLQPGIKLYSLPPAAPLPEPP